MHSSDSRDLRQWARFIPREEVSHVTQWNFGNVTSPLTPDEMEAHRLRDETAQQQLLLAQQDSFTRGYEQGKAEGLQEAQRLRDAYVAGEGGAIMRQTAERMVHMLNHLDQGLQQAEESMAQGVLQLACHMAQQIIRRELRLEPDLVKHTVREALELLVTDSKPATVRLSPQDWAGVQSALKEAAGATSVTWIADAALQPGECLIDVVGSRVDGRWQPRWARAVGALGVSSEVSFAQEAATDAS